MFAGGRGMDWILVVTLLAALAALLDFCGVYALTHGWSAAALLFAAPHIWLLWKVQGRGAPFTGWVLLLCLGYGLVRLCIRPAPRVECDLKRIRVLRGGQLGLHSALAGLLTQPFFYLLLWRLGLLRAFTWKTWLADGLIALLVFFALVACGAIRVLVSSRRLGLLKRVIVICNLWVPFLNLYLLHYLSRKAGEEYDHECYRTELRQIRAESDICATRYPLVLVHGVGFRDLKYFNYWGRIPRELMRYGARIYYGHQQAWGTVEDNAAAIRDTILRVQRETGCEKVNIIAHSKGGLDSRYLITRLDMADSVASLTTISTPHQGSELLDLLCRLPDRLYRLIAGRLDWAFRKMGDTAPDAYRASRQLAPAFCKQFNQETPDRPQVFYQSYATAMKGFFSDFLLCFPWLLLRPMGGENDGLVCVPSARWGQFQGVLRGKFRRGISHGDIIDLKRQDYRGFDVIEIYMDIVTKLKNQGF